MKNCGIICEFNPLHNGHAYLIQRAKELGAERVICIMSGNAVQRGEMALTDRYTRAEAALACGADLVLELPFPWSASGAEFFAEAGAFIASSFCDSLLFGSECGDLSLLARAAAICESEDFRVAYEKKMASGLGCAAAHRAALADTLGASLSSNDVLGVEYLRAIRRNGSSLSALTLPRVGAAYDALTVSAGEFPSATALRHLLRTDGIEALRPYMPQEAYAVLCKAALTDPARLDTARLSFFRLHAPKDFSDIAEADGGIAERICHAAHQATDGDTLMSLLRTKRYTDARLRRAMLFCLTGVTAEDLRHAPVYTHLLAANEAGRALLAERRRDGALPVLAKTADLPDVPYAIRQRALICALDALFTLSLPTPQPTAQALTRSPYIR